MSDVVIRADNLSKRYRIGTYQPVHDTVRQQLATTLAHPVDVLSSFVRRSSSDGHKKQTARNEYIWALKDVSFEVKEGEVVGIIGLNGAGKSTLLKILTRITEPTEGYAEIHGRVSSLLEVGTGFHPELTGRENVYLNGAILGMKKAEIDRKYDEIVAFAEVEKFMDTPVKRYSSGMRVRLAFAVAAHLEPEIMLIDEVLAVGDIAFQKKCLGKLEDTAEGGRTVLFVSHNMGPISTLCPKTILLKEGRIDFMGPTQEAISRYLAGLTENAVSEREWSFEEAPGRDKAKLKSVSVTDPHGVSKRYYSTTEPIIVTVEYWVLTDTAPINIGFRLYDENDNWICSVGNYTETRDKTIRESGLYRSVCTIPANLLNSGKHTISPSLNANLTDSQTMVQHCVAFETVDDHRIHTRYDKWGGIIKPDFGWNSEIIESVESTING